MSRSPGLIAAVSLSGLLVAGCGNGSDPTPVAEASARATVSAAPTISKAQALAAAKAINLVQADVGAVYTSAPHEDVDDPRADKAIDDALRTCFGVDPAVKEEDPLASAPSPDFSIGEAPNGREVYSETEVTLSIEQSVRDLGLLNGPKGPGCLKQAFTAAITDLPAGVSAKPLVVTSAGSVAGRENSFSFDITTAVVGPGVEIPLAFGFDGFLVKHTTVTMLTSGYGAAFPVAERTKLQSALIARAEARAL